MDLTLVAADGHRFDAYAAGEATSRGALVVVQEIFGVNHHIRSVCHRFAQAGYAVIAPALFDRAERGVALGYAPEDVQRGLALRAGIDPHATLLDVLAAAGALAEGVPRGIVGYCWGGSVAWHAATRSSAFAAAVGWYGGGVAAARGEVPRCPTQLHFGEADGSIPLADVEAIRAARPEVELHVYAGAGHGFGCDERGSYSAPDATLAQERTLAFLAKHLA